MTLYFTVKKSLIVFIQNRFNHWLKRRMPAKNSYVLTSKNIFIFPSFFGLTYLAFTTLIFLLGTNYQNNVIILLSYLLGSFFITAMLHSFYNLSGLEVSQHAPIKGYAQQSLPVNINLTSTKMRFNLTLLFAEQASLFKTEILAGSTQVKLPYIATKRGIEKLGRVKISSEYGFGLFTTWTQLDLNCQAIIYPKPIAIIGSAEFGQDSQTNKKPSQVDKNAAKAVNNKSQGDDFYALKNYQTGESLSHVAWKQVARGQGWFSKHYQHDDNNTVWLVLAEMPANNLETKLSMLCFLMLEYHQQGQSFGLDLGQVKIALSASEIQQTITSPQVQSPSSPATHLSTCLLALASFKQPRVGE